MFSSIPTKLAFLSLVMSALAVPTTLLQDDSRDNVVYDAQLAGDWKAIVGIPQTAPPMATARSVRRWGGLLGDHGSLVERSFDSSAAAALAKLAPVNLRRWGGLDVGSIQQRDNNSDDLEQRGLRTKELIATRWKPSPSVASNRRTKTLPLPNAVQTSNNVQLPATQPVLTKSAPSPSQVSTPPPPAPTTSAAPAPAPAAPSPSYGYSSNGYNLDGTHSGVATWYYTGLGACGWYNVDTDYITAISELIFLTWPGATANPNNNPVCGNKIRATYGSKTVDVTVVDYCVGCTNPWHLDMSPKAFQNLTSLDDGLIPITWAWL